MKLNCSNYERNRFILMYKVISFPLQKNIGLRWINRVTVYIEGYLIIRFRSPINLCTSRWQDPVTKDDEMMDSYDTAKIDCVPVIPFLESFHLNFHGCWTACNRRSHIRPDQIIKSSVQILEIPSDYPVNRRPYLMHLFTFTLVLCQITYVGVRSLTILAL